MRIAAEGGSVPPTVPEAAARVLEFTQVARAGDLSLTLDALSVAELVAVMAAGAAAKVSPSVRASMAAGAIEPLLRTAECVAHQHLPGVTVPDSDEPCAPHPDDPASRPLENAVRQHLDNRPDRWRIMVRRLMEAGSLEYAQLVDLVQAVGGGAGEAVEGEP